MGSAGAGSVWGSVVTTTVVEVDTIVDSDVAIVVLVVVTAAGSSALAPQLATTSANVPTPSSALTGELRVGGAT